MRLLMFHLERFWFRPNESVLDDPGNSVYDCLLVWIQSEPKDEGNRASVLRKMVKNIRWLANKAGVNSVVLHSFAHLGTEKAGPAFAEALINEVSDKLSTRDFMITIVPFGMFFEFKMHVMGPSLAKVFKQF